MLQINFKSTCQSVFHALIFVLLEIMMIKLLHHLPHVFIIWIYLDNHIKYDIWFQDRVPFFKHFIHYVFHFSREWWLHCPKFPNFSTVILNICITITVIHMSEGIYVSKFELIFSTSHFRRDMHCITSQTLRFEEVLIHYRKVWMLNFSICMNNTLLSPILLFTFQNTLTLLILKVSSLFHHHHLCFILKDSVF